MKSRVSEILDELAEAKWVLHFGALLALAGFVGSVLYFGYEFEAVRGTTIGHVVKVQGTVRKARVPASEFPDSLRRILDGDGSVPVSLGEQIQTGEDSSAEIVFYGGAKLQLTAGTVVSFESRSENVKMRVAMGRAYLDLSSLAEGFDRFLFQRSDGSDLQVPRGEKLVLALDTLSRLDDAIEIHAGAGARPIFPPLSDKGRIPAAEGERGERIAAPRVESPANEDEIFVKGTEQIFHWNPVKGSLYDPVVGYEVQVRPAFGYDTEFEARKNQVLPTKQTEMSLARVNGGGTFLWSVRAVRKSGERGPASSPQWLELQFPKVLFAPKIFKPKVD